MGVGVGVGVGECVHACRAGVGMGECVQFHVSTQLGVGCHWWFNYPGPLLDVELEFACLSG